MKIISFPYSILNMKTLEMTDKISEKIWGCTNQITNISADMRPSDSNLVPNQCSDIITIQAQGQLWKMKK